MRKSSRHREDHSGKHVLHTGGRYALWHDFRAFRAPEEGRAGKSVQQSLPYRSAEDEKRELCSAEFCVVYSFKTRKQAFWVCHGADRCFLWGAASLFGVD